MTFSRRNFLLGSASAFALRLSDAEAGLRLHGSAASAVQAGKMQANLYLMFTNVEYPFIDICRIAASTWQAFLSPTVDPYQYLNADGYPNAIPAGCFEWRQLLSGQLQPSDPANGNWVLDWTGGPATLNVVFSGANVSQTQISSTSNQIIYNVTSTSLSATSPISVQINITACTGQITKVRCYPLRYQALLNSGQQWDPDFLAFYAPYGRLRMMDWIQTNGNTQVNWASRTTPTQFSQSGWNINTQFYCGQSSNALNTFTTLNAIPSNPTVSAWTQGLMVQTYIPAANLPVFVNFQSISIAGGTGVVTVNATSHGFSNGAQVQFGSGSLPSGGSASTDAAFHLCWGSPVFTIAVVNANSFTLNGINGLTWTNTSGNGTVYNVFQITCGSLPTKAVSGGDGNALFPVGAGGGSSSIISGPSNSALPAQFVYDADFDRLMYSPAPDGTGNGFPNGASIETLVDLANFIYKTNGNLALQEPWFNIPHGADDTYVTNWATYIKNNLNSAITFDVEYSNEVWNSSAGFIQTSWASNKGALKWSVPVAEDGEYQYYGFRARAIMVLIESVFSGQMNRVNRIFGSKTAIPPTFSTVTNRLQCPLGGFSSGDYPINHFDSFCIANYWNMDSNIAIDTTQIWNIVYSGNPTLIATGLAYLDNRFRGDITNGNAGSLKYFSGVSVPPFTNTSGQWKAFHDVVVAYNSTISGKPIQPTSYEGGFNFFSTAISGTNPVSGQTITSADAQTAMQAYWNSALYATFISDTVAGQTAAGYNYPSQFCVVGGSFNSGNPFAMVEPNRLITDPGTIVTPAYATFRMLNGR